MAKHHPQFKNHLRSNIEYRYLENENFEHLFYFAKDIRTNKVEVNKLDQPVLLEYYLEHWQSLQGEKR